MKRSFKLGKQIYMILVFVLLLGIGLQVTRSEALLRIGGKNEASAMLSGASGGSVLSREEIEGLGEPRYLIIFDAADNYSVRVKDNVERTLRYMKKLFETKPVETVKETDASGRQAIVTFPQLDLIPDNAWLETYVEEGGSLLFASVLEPDNTFYRIYRKLGVLEAGYQANVKGITVGRGVLLNEDAQTFGGSIIENTAMQVRLDKESIVSAESSEKVPILWERSYGLGKFVVFNGTMLQEKTSRGFIAAGIGLMTPDFVYPVLNAKLLYIDDFPAPFNPPSDPAVVASLRDQYGRTYSRFIKDIWWPDMIRAAAEYDYKYTGAVIQTYEATMRPPFDDNAEDSLSNLIMYGRDILKQGGEIGIHGYNHQSLTMNAGVSRAFGYKTWASEADMADSVRSVYAFIRGAFPEYGVHAYVPPSNVLGPEGRNALVQAWPELRAISSVYGEDLEGNAYVQEFEIAPDGVAELPRVTSGFINDEFERWALMNAAAALGVISHFVHPDDVISADRNPGKTWEELYEDFTAFLGFAGGQYDWLRPLTATEAANELSRQTNADPHFRHTEKGIEGYINGFSGGELYFVVRTGKKVTELKHAEVTRIGDFAYLVKATGAQFTIGLE